MRNEVVVHIAAVFAHIKSYIYNPILMSIDCEPAVCQMLID